ncbi:chorismate--pyruvate lyase family protein [Umboniibacter marinipuniceus]|uniref:Probable chorismate pyruvate-lyase n=1 Tax=Umboniibacter marinipuniceus TaxID=569599 RepID=A0A3M0AA80_9GAMM|nr:chorismate lyase [Umboniibacter marinipuniceus]RMA82061.1 chorismate lyase [Umboniibacter marinipuniceus]
MWQPADNISSQLPPSIGRWLCGRGSLTEQLSNWCGHDIRVSVLRQDWIKVTDEEAELLGIPKGQGALVREVLLSSTTTPLVFARTVIPDSALKDSFEFIAELGEQPLGHWLFANPHVQRGAIEIQTAQLAAHQFETRHWGRRSLFSYANRQILVAEYFLPSFVELLDA